jgi:hypothetical protein
MTHTLQSAQPLSPSIATPDELRELLGPPPVLGSEDDRAYDAIMGRLTQSLAPRDFIEQVMVKEVADCIWEAARYTRQKMLTMERGFRGYISFPAHKDLDAYRAQQAGETVVDEPGKTTAARNALRHGLYAIKLRDPAPAPEIEALATKLCGGDANPLLREQALVIAENHILLARVRALRLAAIERRLGDARTDQGLQAASADAQARAAGGADPPPAVDPFVECDAVMEALPEIERLERFVQQAWRRRRRAMREFTGVKARS